MIKLPAEIDKGHFVYKQYCRGGKYALYEQWLKDEFVASRAKGDPPTGDVVIGYEIIIIRRKKPYELFGKSYPSKEAYPSNEEFGLYGFTYNSFRNAIGKYRELTNYQNLGVRHRRGDNKRVKVMSDKG